MPKKIILSKEKEDELVNYYLAGNSILTCMKDLKLGPGIVSRIITTERKIGRPHKIYTIDDNYFETIDSPDKAYFLGWIVSDGSITNNTKIELSIQERDIEAINKLIKYTKFTGKIGFRDYSAKGWQNQCRINIMSKQWVTDLNKLGVTRRKTCTTVFPDIPEHLWSHFIRGVFDGDGGVTINKVNYNSLQFYIMGNKPLINKIQDILVEKCNLAKTKLSHTKDQMENIVTLIYGGTPQCLKIAKWLYKDCEDLYLTRKKEKFNEIY